MTQHSAGKQVSYELMKFDHPIPRPAPFTHPHDNNRARFGHLNYINITRATEPNYVKHISRRSCNRIHL